MKKFLCIFLSVLMVISLAACGSQNKDDPSATESVTPTTNVSDSTEPSEDVEGPVSDNLDESGIDWKLEELEVPDITMEVEQKKLVEEVDLSNTIGISKYKYSVDEIKDKLQNNKFISDKYVLAVEDFENVWQKEYSDVGLQQKYKYNKTIRGVLKKDATNSKYFQDFSMSFKGDTNESDGYDYITIYFESLDISKSTQEEIYNILTSILSENLSKYLVYGFDDDGLKKDGKDLDGAKDMYVELEDKYFKYVLSRSITLPNNNNESEIYFTLGKLEAKFENKFEHFSGDYQSQLAGMNYAPDKFFSNAMGGLDITDMDTFLDKFFKLGTDKYIATCLRNNNYIYERTVGDNGISVYEVTFEAVAGEENISLLACPYLDINYTIIEKEGQVMDMYYDIEYQSTNIDDDQDKESSFKKLHTDMLKQIKCILGEDIDLSKLTYESGKSEYSATVLVNYYGTDYEVDIDMDLGHTILCSWRGGFKLNISMF